MIATNLNHILLGKTGTSHRSFFLCKDIIGFKNGGIILSWINDQNIKLFNELEIYKENDNYKQRLAGNVSNSLGIIDENDFFQNKVILPQVEIFRKNNGGSDPVRNFVQMEGFTPLKLTEFWVNYQYPGEFNPYHFHGGAYSFAIWLSLIHI